PYLLYTQVGKQHEQDGKRTKLSCLKQVPDVVVASGDDQRQRNEEKDQAQRDNAQGPKKCQAPDAAARIEVLQRIHAQPLARSTRARQANGGWTAPCPCRMTQDGANWACSQAVRAASRTGALAWTLSSVLHPALQATFRALTPSLFAFAWSISSLA